MRYHLHADGSPSAVGKRKLLLKVSSPQMILIRKKRMMGGNWEQKDTCRQHFIVRGQSCTIFHFLKWSDQPDFRKIEYFHSVCYYHWHHSCHFATVKEDLPSANQPTAKPHCGAGQDCATNRKATLTNTNKTADGTLSGILFWSRGRLMARPTYSCVEPIVLLLLFWYPPQRLFLLAMMRLRCSYFCIQPLS